MVTKPQMSSLPRDHRSSDFTDVRCVARFAEMFSSTEISGIQIDFFFGGWIMSFPCGSRCHCLPSDKRLTDCSTCRKTHRVCRELTSASLEQDDLRNDGHSWSAVTCDSARRDSLWHQKIHYSSMSKVYHFVPWGLPLSFWFIRLFRGLTNSAKSFKLYSNDIASKSE